MEQEFVKFGFPAMFLVMVTKMIFDLLNKINSKIAKQEESKDAEPKDYRLEQALTKLSDAMVRQTTILERMSDDNRDTLHALQRVETKVDAFNSRSPRC